MVKGSQDDISRQQKDLELEVQVLGNHAIQLDDVKVRISESEKSIQTINISCQKKIRQVQEDFSNLRVEFRREEEYSRVARRAAEGLQEEYCRIIHSVASEKQRNMMFIEKAKRAFESEILVMNVKVAEIAQLKELVNQVTGNKEEKDKQTLSRVEQMLMKYRIDNARLIDELQQKMIDLEKNNKSLTHQQ